MLSLKRLAAGGMIAGILAGWAARAAAQETAPDPWRQEFERRLDLLSREVEKTKLGEAAAPAADRPAHGLAPAASKVYRVSQGVSLGGYGEMVLQEYDNERDNGTASGQKRQVDLLRAILYTGYKFNDRILFNSEIEFEHATTGGGANARGEVSVEFAYLDFLLSTPASIRAGLLLVPMGFINELHEPTVFHGALRPYVEQNIIPTTWRENGVGLHGEWGPLAYRTYLLSGLQAVSNTGVSGFNASTALRNGRSKGARSFAEDVASVTRLDWRPTGWTTIGGSYYYGQSGQNFAGNGQEIDAPVELWETHAEGQWAGFESRLLYARGRIGDVALINAANTLTGDASVGERFFGGYAELAYNVLTTVPTDHYLAPFFRYERYDTQQRVPGGFSRNPANSRKVYTVGLTYRPIPQVAIKADWQDIDNQAGTGVNQVNLALGYVF